MRLYLCSYRLTQPDALFSLTSKKPSEISVAIIPNAKDYYAERARNFGIEKTNQYLSDFGLKSHTFDLKDYEHSSHIKYALKDFDLIWVSGGNTFCLRYEMKRSGFDQAIKELLKEDAIAYAGESAGACVMGNTLKGLETADEPAYAEEVIWEGLNVVPNFILPHTDNAMFAEDIKVARETHKDNPNVIELTDAQALIVNGKDQKIVG